MKKIFKKSFKKVLTYCTMCYMIHTTKHTKCVTQRCIK
nr:MAG TPA: hypothetical protein [Caudoviricetes sp.]